MADQIIINTKEQWWYNRGVRDAKGDRAPIFASNSKYGTFAIADGFCEDEISEKDAGKAYLAGYKSV